MEILSKSVAQRCSVCAGCLGEVVSDLFGLEDTSVLEEWSIMGKLF